MAEEGAVGMVGDVVVSMMVTFMTQRSVSLVVKRLPTEMEWSLTGCGC